MANTIKNRRYHFLYKTTNLITKRYYYGMHSTNNLEDGYVGSGERLWYEIRKYGRENFKCEILEFFENRETLAAAEKELVTEDLVNAPDCLNLKEGGQGGFTLEQTRNGGKLSGNTHATRMRIDPNFRKKIVENLREVGLRRSEEQGTEFPLVKHRISFKGKHHRKASIEKQKASREASGANLPERNSQYGTCWITNGEINRKVKRGEVLPEGWNTGQAKKKKVPKCCIKCGKDVRIAKKTGMCPLCFVKEKREKIPEKEFLENLIKVKDFSEIAKMYNVSRTTIRNWCLRYELHTVKVVDMKKSSYL